MNEAAPAWTLASQKAYFEAILEEQRLAIHTADAEREKSAQIVRESLTQMVTAADAALGRHIEEQVRQIRQIIDLNLTAVDAAFAASEKAIQKAEAATEKRFESVNEFRAQLATQTHSFMPREVAEAKLKEISTKVDDLTARVNTTTGKSAGVTASIGLMIAVSGVGLAVVVVFVNVLLAN